MGRVMHVDHVELARGAPGHLPLHGVLRHVAAPAAQLLHRL